MNARLDPGPRPVTVRTLDDRRLAGTLFPAVAPRGAVLIAGATAVPHRFYRAFGTWLASRGFTVLAFDYRGVGESRAGRPRDETGTLRDWGERDLPAALDLLRDAAPGLPVFVVGHSFGGQALGLADALAEVDGVLTVGAQFGWWGHWSGLERLRMWATWHVLFPSFLAVFGYVPGWSGLGHDLPGPAAREWARWCASPGYLTDHVAGSVERLGAVRTRVEVWGFTDDGYAPSAAVHAFAGRVGPQGAFVRLVAPTRAGGRSIGHFGMFRLAFADTLWTDVEDVLIGWIDVR